MAENPLQELMDKMREQIKAEVKEELKDVFLAKPDVLDGYEAADMLRISYWQVMYAAKSGKIPSFKMGRRVLFRRDALLGWAMKQEELKFRKVCKIRRVG